jgi:hypothetical protein
MKRMADILIDMTEQPAKRYKINMCHYCTDSSGKPKPILPDDKQARQTDNGWICGYCISGTPILSSLTL